jgi:mannose-1-phosphate guanylyltransferase
MKAMILAGGLSTRLYPLTKQVPKPLVPVVGVPNAIHLIRYLRSYGCDQIAINVHYHAEAIVRTLGDGSRFDVEIRYLHEPQLMGSAGALKPLEDFFRDQSAFVVVGCDELTDLPLDALVDFHRRRGAIATIGLVECPEVDQYGVVALGDDGRIVGFQEKPARGTELSRLANTGIYAFTPEIFEHIPAGEFYDFGKQVFPSLQRAAAPFYGFEAGSAYWADIGTPAEYRRATCDVLCGVFRIHGMRANGTASSAVIAEGARIDGPVWIGERARIERGATVAGPSVIGDDVSVGRDARIERSILWTGAAVARGARLLDSIVGINYRVDSGIVLENAIVANE